MAAGNARGGTPAYIIPTVLLADTLRPLIEELNHRLDPDAEEADGNGALAVIAGRVSRTLEGVEAEAVPRRVWSILNHETVRTHTEIADAILLALDKSITRDTDLPTLPGTMAGALEMVDVWAPELDELEARRIAKQMLRFSAGFVNALKFEPEELIEKKAAKAVGEFIRAHAPLPAPVVVEAELVVA